MDKNLTPLPIRMYWSAAYFFNRFRYITLTVVLGIATITAYQYWLELKSDPLIPLTQKFRDGMITMKYPKTIRKDQRKHLIFFSKSSDTTRSQSLLINIKVTPENTEVSPKQISLHLNKSADVRSVMLKAVTQEDITVSANISGSSIKLTLNGTISSDRFSKEIQSLVSMLSTVLSGLLTIVTAILQFRQIIRRDT